MGQPGPKVAEETQATVADTPAARSRPRGAAPTTGSPPPEAHPFSDALREAEIRRTRIFVPVVIAMALAASVLLQLVDGDPLAKRTLYAGMAACICAALYLHSLTRNPERFTEVRLGFAYGICIVGVFTGVFYWGIFSPVAAIVGLGIFFVGIGRSAGVANVLYGLCVLIQGGLATATIAGWLDDPGLVTADRPDATETAVQQVMVQIVFLVTYLVARATRNQLDEAVSDHDRQVRAIAQRDALLNEARQELDRALQIGGPGRYTDQVVGSYRLGVIIGRGAMGDVYEAAHVESAAPAAVKLLNPDALRSSSKLERFYREARAASKLRSENIVEVLEVAGPDDPLPYLAMEKLEGEDLAQQLRERRRLSLGEATRLVRQVARGLEVARRHAIVHRDIKPQNLFAVESGDRPPTWKILDFGVSKLADHSGTLTQGQVVGTPMYMAPEQARGEAVDHRADDFALATVVYRAITGRPPYSSKDMPTILHDVVYQNPPRPGSLVDLPRDIDRVLAVAMAKDPDDRFDSAVAFADALEAAAAGALDARSRARADALLARSPWGAHA